MRRTRRKRPLIERLESHTMPEPNTGCWIWTGFTFLGYGKIRVDGSSKLAHRVYYELIKSPIPSGMCLCHHCDTPACVNPDHMFVGSHMDNTRDKQEKGRMKKGESTRASKFKNAEVNIIREAHSLGYTMIGISRYFKVTHKTIAKIVYRETWRHI
jgi:hypothetical protein